MSESDYQENLKTLRLREENLLRDVDLQFDKVMKEEETKIRGELEKKHTEEQIKQRREEVEEMMRLRKDAGIDDITHAAGEKAS